MSAFTTSLKSELNTQPYAAWEPINTIDPRRAKPPEFEAGYTAIVGAEGPMLAYRMFSMYAKASGLGKIVAATKVRMNYALELALEKGVLIAELEQGDPEDVSTHFLRLPDQPLVLVREAGGRSIDEIPPSELAEVMLAVRTLDELLGRDEIYREVMAHYELQKITALARGILDQVLADYF